MRQAVRAVIGEYFRSRGEKPLSAGGLRENTARITDFLFAEPVAAHLALDSEEGLLGGGQSLTRETLDGLAGLLGAGQPGLPETEVRLRVWTLVTAVHGLLRRPEGCREWTGLDPRVKEDRQRLLAGLCGIVEG